MTRRFPRSPSMGFVFTIALGVLGGCGDDGSTGSTRFNDDDAGRGASSSVATGGAGGGFFTGSGGGLTGGAPGVTGGTGGAGASPVDAGATRADAGDAAACVSPAVVDPSIFPSCPLCANARCVPNALLPAGVADQLEACDPDNKCVPDELVATGGNFLFETCESLDGAEGRCVRSCLPAVSSQVAFLPRATCGELEVCAPCFNPLDGLATGACGLSCDPGPSEPPVLFEKCCSDRGSCVPPAAVPADLQSSLGSDTCADTTRLCAPDAFANTTFQPANCTSVGGVEGRCIPDCVPAVQERADSLLPDTCDTGELCAPCFDPITGEDTGACNINGDAPVAPPIVFAKCCSDLGTCVPASAVPASQQALLSSDTCTGLGDLCAPTALIDAAYTPPVCTSVGGYEGRCLPSCLPDVAAQADRLPPDVCAAGHLCAPCFDPVTGEDTGACTLNGDAPANPPGLFDACCDGAGKCVPESLVPADQQAFLGMDVCTTTGTLCAPTAFIDTSYVPPTCDSIAGAEGRCVPECLPAVASQADRLLQDTCAEGELCAPCYDPVTGDPTGACEINGDVPAEPPVVFASCCGNLGSCVPTSLVPVGQQSLLDADTCAGQGELCVPVALADTSYQPPACDSVGGFEGRCLPACLPDIEAQADRLPIDVCAQGELCAPCFDPTTGADTGACTLNGDVPAEPPGTFQVCCGGLGTCVPSALVPAEQQSLLGTDVCLTAGYLCAPTKLTDSTYVPAACDSILGAEGRCLAACLPDVAAQADRLPVDVCETGELCAPCYDPLTGLLTGACSVNGDAPTEPPVVFAQCCGGLGSCIPSTLVPSEQQALLGTETCAGQGDLCVPTDLADSTYTPPSCDSVGGFEGRCLPACLPDIAAQADRLPQDSCAVGHLCAPCYDPVTGANTGACNVNGDAPVEPPGTFQVCCGGIGTCVPTSLVPAGQQSLLGTDVCTTTGELCAPTKLTDPSFMPEPCDSIAGAEGRCLAACLPDVAAQAGRLSQDVCDAGELCAPCYDPLTGLSTGACTINGDAPIEPPYVFAGCCGGLGSCVPDYLVPPDQQALLGTDTCSGQGELCAPTDLADSSYQPPSCDSISGFEGRCLPACLPDVAAQANRLPQDVCAAGYLCAPCYDPITSVDTGACTLNGDVPAEPMQVFDACCSGDGVCVPDSLVPAGQQSLLGADTCTDPNTLCAPTALTDPTVQPDVCYSFEPQHREGRCIAACVPSVQARAGQLQQETCASGELCAPCFDPVVGGSTGACEINGDSPQDPDPGTFVTCQATNSLLTLGCLTWPPALPPVEGRCVPNYIALAQSGGNLLCNFGCQVGELCAPCVDPVSGTPTGACP